MEMVFSRGGALLHYCDDGSDTKIFTHRGTALKNATWSRHNISFLDPRVNIIIHHFNSPKADK